jgi:NADPH:quinone reductase-like Zn-dependent oxidoreductase
MKAIVQETHGSPDVLELRDVDRPQAKDDEVLVRVRAASVGAWDAHAMTGEPRVMGMFGMLKPKNRIAGRDLAGLVEAAGKNVTRFRPGDEVYGEGHGAFAEFTCVSEGDLAYKPRNLTFEQAAAVPIAGITALVGLRDVGQIRGGQQVLIIGASGGVGTFAVQIAKTYGAIVTAVCSTRNVDLVRSIGADHVIDYTRQDFTETRQRYDLILELADSRTLSELRKVLEPKGTLVMSSGVGGRWMGPLGRMIRAVVASPFVSQTVRVLTIKTTTSDLDVLREFVESGKVEPVIDKTYPLAATPDAVGYVERGHTQGKTVISMQLRGTEAESS